MADLKIAWIISIIQLVCCTSRINCDTTYDDLKTDSKFHMTTITSSQDIQRNIPVIIGIQPYSQLHGKIYVPTGKNLTIRADVTDDKFRNLSLTYQWSTRQHVIDTTNVSQIVYAFDQPDENEFMKVLVFHPQNDTGVSQEDIIVRDPIKLDDPVGKTFLEHGELLDLMFRYNGTGPYQYCFRLCYEKSEADCEPCDSTADEARMTASQHVAILKYLPKVGNYTLFFSVYNIATRVDRYYAIKITDILRPQTIPYIPIISSILAVLILLVGLALHLKFKQTIYTETADFDFIRQAYDDRLEEVWDEEQSFFQRVRYLLFQMEWSTSDANLSDSNMSSSRAHLV